MTPPATRALAATLAIGLCACTPVRRDAAGEYGPPADQLEMAPAQAPATTRLPRRFEPALLRAPSKALVVRRTRLDAGQPELQNWEVALDVVRADPATADGDELLALWMNARTGADGVSDTGLSLARSIDGGRSFAPVATTAPPMAAGIPFDPMVESDPVAGAVYVGAMSQSSADRAAWIAPSMGADSAAFQLGRVVATGVRVDKGWLAAGPAPGGGRALYFIDRSGARASTDRGVTWSAAVDLPQAQGLPLPRVYPDATLGVTYIRSDQPVYTRSNDLARSFAAPSLIHDPAAPATGLMDATPGSYRVAPATVIARSPVDGTIYAVLADVTQRVGTEADVDLLLFESVDGGATWSAGRNITAAAPAWSDQFLPWIEVDAQGRLHLAWYDTRRHAGNDAAASAPVDFWYAVSADRGRNWEAQRLTEAPIESASTNWSPLGPQPFQVLGDYITLALSAHAAYVAHPVAEGGVIGMAVSRIALGGGSARPINDPRGLTGAWYEPATSGQGIELQWLAGERLLLFFYGHRDDGSNLFLVGTRDGRFDYGQEISVPLVVTRGGRFNGLDPMAIRREPWGSVRLVFDSCDAATAVLSGLDGTQALVLERIALAPGLPCD